MSTPTVTYREILDHLPAASTLTLRNVSWEEYEALLESLVDASGFRVSYADGTLQIVTLSTEHESYCRLDREARGPFERPASHSSPLLRLFDDEKEGAQQGRGARCLLLRAVRPGHRKQNPHRFRIRSPPPDVVVEIDVAHDSVAKFRSYADLGVPELWRYDGEAFFIYRLDRDKYLAVESSLALPQLTASVLTRFLNLSRERDQYDVLLAFEEWLESVR